MNTIGLFIVAASGPLIGYGVLLVWRWHSRRAAKRNPLTRDLLRRPGQSLEERIEGLTLDVIADLSAMMFLTPFVALAFALQKRTILSDVLAGLLGFCLCGYFAFQVVRRMRHRDRLRLGLDGEQATGEELNQLMLRGCRVFHDFPAERFNIDHVVVGPGGVFAVETKARAKPKRGMGKSDGRVAVESGTLCFPGWKESGPIEQTIRQAEWLQGWLTRAVGESVAVRPALALPGWFVDRKTPSGPLVFNPKNSTFLAEPREGSALSDSLVQRIAHQLEQKCRDVAPKAYSESPP